MSHTGAIKYGYEAFAPADQDDHVDPLDMVQFMAGRIREFAEGLAHDMAWVEKRIGDAKFPDLAS